MDLTDIMGVQSTSVLESAKYASSILDLCANRGIRFTGGRGSLAARLLKASPEWKRGRKAAPEFINGFSRTKLPGNYYGLGVTEHTNFRNAYYIDQTSAHHSVAATTSVPNPDEVRALGYHRTAETGKTSGKWLSGERAREFCKTHYGLVAAVVSVNHIPDRRKHLYPPFLHTPGRRLEFFYTNELEFFRPPVATLEYLVAAWATDKPDLAVKEFAQWALENRNKGPGRKAVLLAAYGALAIRTDRPAVTYHTKHRRGVITEIPVAGKMVEYSRMRKPDQPQPAIVNVLARGVIEAETRRRSLSLAHELDAMGIPVLSVYVDGLIVQTNELPMLPVGWEVEAELTNVSFQHPSAFRSDTITKQPGIPRGPLQKFMTPVEEMRARSARMVPVSR